MSEPSFDDVAKKVDGGLQGSFENEHGGISGSVDAKPAGKNEGADAGEWARGLGVEDAPAERTEGHETGRESGMGNIDGFFDEKNKGFFGRMSEKGKGIISGAYEGLYKIPGVSRIVGKMEIAYNQFWMDRHEKKAVSLKGKMDGLDAQLGALGQAKQEMEGNIKELQRLGVPKVESLQLKLKDIDRQSAELLSKKDATQSKFEARDNKVKLYANERDGIADRLIGRYDEKLKPMEQELEKMQTCRDQVDLLATVMEVRHNEQTTKINGIESKKTQIEEILRKTGTSEREIKKTVASLSEQVSQGREKMKKERENLKQRQDEINRKIAKLDAKANPYRDKREQFMRVKEGRPLDIKAETRKRGEEFKGREETEAHTREEASVSSTEDREGSANVGTRSVREEGGSYQEAEYSPEEDKRPTVADHISALNAYLQENGSKEEKKMLVDPRDFVRSVKMLLSQDSRLDFEDFKKVLGKYYKYKKISLGNLDKVSKAARERIESQG